MIKVHLNSKFITDGFANSLSGELTHVANIDTDSLDVAYAVGQSITTNWTDHSLVENVSGKQQRSVAIGDVLEFENGQRWMVSLVGFTRL